MSSKKEIENDSGKYWPYMILGFLFIGLTLGYWTIKNTISLPVHQSNEFMQSYQDADRDANKIQKAQDIFDSKYSVEFSGLNKSDFKPKFLKRKPHQYYVLSQSNSVKFKVVKKDGSVANGIKMEGILTRPQTESDDKRLNITNKGSGEFEISNFKVEKPGRYIIRVKFSKGDAVKYLDIYGFKAK